MSCFSTLALSCFFLCILSPPQVISKNAADISNSPADQCINNEGATIYVRLIDDESYPFVEAKCSGNGYMIINVNNDENWIEYFSSNRMYHRSLMGPIRDDIVNWNEWFLPNVNEFLVSPDCSVCDENELMNSKYDTQSSYYMMPAEAGCSQLPIGRIGCDMDYYSYECRVCDTSNGNYGYWDSKLLYNGLNKDALESGEAIYYDEYEDALNSTVGLCGFTVRDALAPHIEDTFEHCKRVTKEDTIVEGERILPRRKPSIGTDGQFCMCIKPQINDFYDVYEYQDETEFIKSQDTNEIEETEFVQVELYQEDFTSGTYRILTPGKYIIMEDIVFDFNAPEGWKNGLDSYHSEGMWWPDDNDKYPGAGELKDAFFMGFFAGISVECTDEKGVIIDLNGHTLKMSKAFFYQQSFFSIISLSGQSFLPGQGPGFFGSDPIMSQNVEIYNGKLGLSSHHGILGHLNKNIYIHDIKITQFKTHGVQLNGFTNVKIENVEIYENQYTEKLSPWFAHLRHYLPIHRLLVEDLKEQGKEELCIKFGNRLNDDEIAQVYDLDNNGNEACVTYADMVENVETLLDMAFEFAVFDKSEEELLEDASENRKQLWELNRDMIINSNRNFHVWTATLYGIFLNYQGSNVIGWYAGSENVKSNEIEMNNVNIHDLYHDTQENFAFSRGVWGLDQRVLNCLNAPFNAYHIFGEESVNLISQCNVYRSKSSVCDSFELTYVGNLATDIQLATFYLINEQGMSWDYCAGGAADMAKLVEFAMSGLDWGTHEPDLKTSHDPMIHPGKGILGLRLNGVNKAKLSNIHINNIISDTKLGSLLAGKYSSVISQQDPYMEGFSMNLANGLTITMSDEVELDNINIKNVKSATGYAYGLVFWFQSIITAKTGINIENIAAGYKLMEDENYVDDILNVDGYLPNRKPQVCPFLLYDDNEYPFTITNEGEEFHDLLNVKCATGYQACEMQTGAWTQLGFDPAVYSNGGIYDECTNDEELDVSKIYNLPKKEKKIIMVNDDDSINDNNDNNDLHVKITNNAKEDWLNDFIWTGVAVGVLVLAVISLIVVIINRGIVRKCVKTEIDNDNNRSFNTYQTAYGAIDEIEGLTSETIFYETESENENYVSI